MSSLSKVNNRKPSGMTEQAYVKLVDEMTQSAGFCKDEFKLLIRCINSHHVIGYFSRTERNAVKAISNTWSTYHRKDTLKDVRWLYQLEEHHSILDKVMRRTAGQLGVIWYRYVREIHITEKKAKRLIVLWMMNNRFTPKANDLKEGGR